MIVHDILIQGRVPGLGAVECPSSPTRRLLDQGVGWWAPVCVASSARQLHGSHTISTS